MSFQHVNLFGERHLLTTTHGHLTFSNHVHQFNAGQHTRSCPARLQAQHGLCVSFDGPMILLQDAVEILDLTNLSRNVPVSIDLLANIGMNRIAQRLIYE